MNLKLGLITILSMIKSEGAARAIFLPPSLQQRKAR